MRGRWPCRSGPITSYLVLAHDKLCKGQTGSRLTCLVRQHYEDARGNLDAALERRAFRLALGRVAATG